jgi:hypothetical protein
LLAGDDWVCVALFCCFFSGCCTRSAECFVV